MPHIVSIVPRNTIFKTGTAQMPLGNARLETDKLSHQTVGRVWLAAWYADVDMHFAEMVCRDTIEWD